MIGTLVGGQVLAREPDCDKMRETARELEVDEDEFVEAARKTQIVPEAAIERATNFIFEFSRVVSEMAYKTYEIIRLSDLAVSQKSDFLANMSHEIRTPMNAVLGMAEMALREEMTPQVKQYVRQIRSSGKHLLVIINDILDFSKIKSGKLDIIEVDYEPLPMLNDLVNVINTRIGSQKLEFTIDYDPALPHKLHGDNVRIYQILLNILNNAVKFTEHGEVHLDLHFEPIDDDTIMLKAVVRDTGIGIRREDMEKLFQSFQQVDSKRIHNIEGTGLGLAIAKQLLNLMNGSISVESEYEKGSTFYVELPQKVVSHVPTVPCAENGIKAALLIENEYVHAQLCRDLSRLKVSYAELADAADYNWIIAESTMYGEKLEKLLADDPGLNCLLISPFNAPCENIPGVRQLHKPAFSMGLYTAFGLGTDTSSAEVPERDAFSFTAPDAHVLIVDDNTINLSVASGIIEPLGMHVDTANGAAETIEKVKKLRYDIIFMDHMMPEVDGVETTHIIRRLVEGYENVPIIALTANVMGGTKEMFLREGMNDFVAKPIEVHEMVTMVRKWLPKELIIPGSSKKKQEKSNSGTVPYIEGLNTRQALAMLGSEKLYMQILRDFYQSIDKRIEMITRALDQQDIKAYTIEVHSLKSVSKQIGADGLSQFVARLEKAGNEHDTELISAKTDELIFGYKKCKELLAPLFSENTKAPAEVTEDYGTVSALLDSASAAVGSGDDTAVSSVIEKLAECSLTTAQAQCREMFSASVKSHDLTQCAVILDMWSKIAVEETGKGVSGADEIRSAVEGMQNALDEFDSLMIDDALEQLDALNLPEDQSELLLSLKKAVEDSEIDQCSDIMEEWRNLL